MITRSYFVKFECDGGETEGHMLIRLWPWNSLVSVLGDACKDTDIVYTHIQKL